MKNRGNRQQAIGNGGIQLLWAFFCSLALGFSLIASGCGRKGDLRAPELTAPETISNLAARQEAAGITLSWGRPTRYVDGREMKDLAAFVVFRKDIAPDCVECPVPYRQHTVVDIEDQDRFTKQKQFRFLDELVQPKTIYRYRVASQLKDGTLSAPSNEVEIVRGP